VEHVGGTDRLSLGERLAVPLKVRPAAMRAERRHHGGRYNVAFCDGHLENLKTNALFATNTAVLKRWNKDNEPHAAELLDSRFPGGL
jgi:prepilin-type processing-associated H-X9-DG protein